MKCIFRFQLGLKVKPLYKKAVILRGAPHSGKSYYAAFHFPKDFIISSDHQFLLPSGKIRYDSSKEAVSHRNCRLEFLAACQASVPIIVVDDFNIFQKDLFYYSKISEFYGYQIEIVRMNSNPISASKYNWRRFDYKKCAKMQLFLDRQPVWPNENQEPVFNYIPGTANIRIRANRTLSSVKIRKKIK